MICAATAASRRALSAAAAPISRWALLSHVTGGVLPLVTLPWLLTLVLPLGLLGGLRPLCPLLVAVAAVLMARAARVGALLPGRVGGRRGSL